MLGLVAAVLHLRHDALVALGRERWTEPALLLGLHLLLALTLLVLAAALGRRRDRWSRRGALALALLPPLVSLGGVVLPGLTAPPLRPAEPVTGPAQGPPLLLLTLDTFRADHLRADLTPRLHALGEAGLRLTQAVTPVPLTAPAHASMLTGLSPLDHGLRANGMRLGGPDAAPPSVVEELRAAGWQTAAFLAAHVVDRDTWLQAGFHHFDDRWGRGQRLAWAPALRPWTGPSRPPVRGGEEVVERAQRWLEAAEGRPGRPFLWVHLYDAHAPYQPPSEHAPSAEALAQARALDRAALRAEGGGRGLLDVVARGRVHHQKLMYEGEVRFVDVLAGRLLDALPPEAPVVVVGDHGESLDEHEYFFNHGARLYEPSLHVPFLVRWPGELAPGSTEEGLVSVEQVAGVLREVAGLPGGTLPLPREAVLASTTGQQARQLGMFLRAGERPQRGGPKRQAAAVRLDGAKIVAHGGDEPVFYDLVHDPGELQAHSPPLALEAHTETVRTLLDLPAPTLDDDQLERLRALGYVP